MNLCLITPAKFVHFTRMLPGRFCLGQVAKNFPNYKEFFVNASKEGYSVILDNGAFEEESLEDEELIELAEEIQPKILVVPDKMNSGAYENLARAKSFLEEYFPSANAPYSFMYVPQCKWGCDRAYTDTLRLAINSGSFSYIGIPRNALYSAFGHFTRTTNEALNKFFFGAWAVQQGIFTTALAHDVKFHLLGIGDELWMLQYLWWAESADTASLFHHASKGIAVDELGNLPQLDRPSDYFRQSYVDDRTEECLRKNCMEATFHATKARKLRSSTIGGKI